MTEVNSKCIVDDNFRNTELLLLQYILMLMKVCPLSAIQLLPRERVRGYIMAKNINIKLSSFGTFKKY